jgi:hypothetical protein
MEVAQILEAHAKGSFEEFHDKAAKHVTYSLIINNDGSRSTAMGPCHACVDRALKRDRAVAVITYTDNTLVNNPGAIAYYDWLINKSFFSDVFLCKDAALSLRYGFVKKIDVNAAKWLGAAQLCRLPTSEYKSCAIAMYDILASGWEIHPMLLTFLACTASFSSNGKVISANHNVLANYKAYFSNTQTTHLPFTGVSSNAELIEFCRDDPNKEIAAALSTVNFKNSKWPSGSHGILTKNRYNQGRPSDDIMEMLTSCMVGPASILFNAKEEKEYKSLWEPSINTLLASLPNYNQETNRAGKNINLSAIEQLSKKLKLGK